jgi:TnpA family transposase
VAGDPDAYPWLAPALTRPIRWELVSEQYDQMIKYATAIRTRTASTEAILRRFTRNASHPTYAAMLEVGRAQKTPRSPADPATVAGGRIGALT